ncbi:MAG: hypothetical protein WC525_00555 [Candidatus Thermoplasmatota archaeon]
MELILGMDLGVFVAWIGTLLATILCILYGIYHQFIKKTDTKQEPPTSKKGKKKPKGDS